MIKNKFFSFSKSWKNDEEAEKISPIFIRSIVVRRVVSRRALLPGDHLNKEPLAVVKGGHSFFRKTFISIRLLDTANT